VPLQEEARRQGIDVTDIEKVRELLKGGFGALLAAPDADRAAGHPSQQVPRFGNDLGFSQRGIQVRGTPTPPLAARFRTPCYPAIAMPHRSRLHA